MGSFFKECEHPSSRWSKCPHEYTIRYRNASGRQTEESGFTTQELAKSRLAEVYHARKSSPMSVHKAERIKKYGSMQFAAYTADWLKGQRHQSPTTLRNTESTLKNHLLPAFASRRMGTFDHKVVEAFITEMERNGVGLAAQTNAFIRLKTILSDAHRLGLYEDSPMKGVRPPQYDPARAVIPSVPQLQSIRTAGDDVFRLVAELMSGCGLRNGEAYAVNTNNRWTWPRSTPRSAAWPIERAEPGWWPPSLHGIRQYPRPATSTTASPAKDSRALPTDRPSSVNEDNTAGFRRVSDSGTSMIRFNANEPSAAPIRQFSFIKPIGRKRRSHTSPSPKESPSTAGSSAISLGRAPLEALCVASATRRRLSDQQHDRGPVRTRLRPARSSGGRPGQSVTDDQSEESAKSQHQYGQTLRNARRPENRRAPCLPPEEAGTGRGTRPATALPMPFRCRNSPVERDRNRYFIRSIFAGQRTLPRAFRGMSGRAGAWRRAPS
ncbi:hypothetical protein [Kitasatospora purpeofusca]|uniref:hypothetical protein n=1 Tax=Kitasatospora purpeofusca TaxID=67352 RepID=UPI003F4AD97B